MIKNIVLSVIIRNPRGEVAITKVLQELDIDYQKEFIFPSTKFRFDFYLPEFKAAIEYDGIQHFETSSFFKDGLETIQARDETKNVFCLINNIKLYRIPYYDYDKIAQIIYKIFKEKSSTTIEKYLITEQSRA